MNSPIFSVVIPAYNQAEFLGQAIERVLNQTLKDLEVIIVNDRASDHTEAIVRQFPDPRINYSERSIIFRTGLRGRSGLIPES